MTTEKRDVVIVGGGPGGYVAAIRAAQLGLRTTLIEREHLGGICLNWGCIPTKALLHTAETWRSLQHAQDLGLRAGDLSIDFPKVIERSRAIAEKLSQGVRQLMKKNKVEVIAGEGRLAGAGRVVVAATTGDRTIEARHIVIATGARPREFPDTPADGVRVWNYRHALAPATLPKTLLVVGAGAIGMEFASFYSSLGTAVTVIEARERVLPGEDEEISAFVEKAYRSQGVEIRTGATIQSIDTDDEGATLTLRNGTSSESLRAERVLLSIGIAGNVERLGLETTKVQVDATHILVDSHCRTAEPGVYAIGDVAGAPWLAHKASHDAMACIENIAGLEQAHSALAERIPSCTYGHPQTASVGLTEQAAKASGREIRVGRFPFQGNGKALAIGEPAGFAKTIFDARTGEFLGAHLVGPQVTELIHSFGLAQVMETTEAELIQTVFPHPTLSEALHESVLAALGRAVHV